MEYFPLIKHSLLDNFSLNCGWVELKTDDKQIYVQKEYKFGTLKYKNRVGKLSLFQGWNANSPYQTVESNMPLYRKSNIMGYIANDSTRFVYIPKISIYPGYLNLLRLVPVSYSDWHLTRFSIGNFIPQNLSTKIFNKVLLKLTLLDDWIKPAFRFETPYKSMETKVKTTASNVLAYFTYNGQLFKVELVGNVHQEHSQNDKYVKYKNDTWILIEGENNISSDQAIFFATEFRKMFSIVLARPLNTIQLSKKGMDNKTSQSLTEDIYFPEMEFEDNKKKLLIYEMFRQKRDIQMNNLIPNWFNKGENFDLLVQNYLLTISYNETVQNKLINLTEGIEAYYRDREATLCEKIQYMLHSLPSYVLNELKKYVGNIDNWALSLKQTRVYIAHGNKRMHVIDDIIELSQNVNAFQYLIQYFILQKLDMKIDYKQMVGIVLDSCFNTEKV